uniref:EF-hand domain-containing protein n=1 Tax=Meloidogyne floridensis TaxID=298350 RepID=A0A915NMT4_9BILA
MSLFFLIIFLFTPINQLLIKAQQNLAVHELPLPTPIILEDVNSTSISFSNSLNSTTSSLGTTAPLTSQLAKPPSEAERINRETGTTMAGIHQQLDNQSNSEKTKINSEKNLTIGNVARRSPSPSTNYENEHRHSLKPETKDEMFARMDSDGDNMITLQDYMNRDRYYVESVKAEFNDIDTNGDGMVSKHEFDAFVRRLDEQREAAMRNASNFTLQRNDANKDGELSEEELGAYIKGTLQRNIARLPQVFSQFDRDENGKLNLEEFHNLDFNFPWEKFPLSTEQLPNNNHQQLPPTFFSANGPVPPPFVNEQAAAAIPSDFSSSPSMGGQMHALPVPQPIRIN